MIRNALYHFGRASPSVNAQRISFSMENNKKMISLFPMEINILVKRNVA